MATRTLVSYKKRMKLKERSRYRMISATEERNTKLDASNAS